MSTPRFSLPLLFLVLAPAAWAGPLDWLPRRPGPAAAPGAAELIATLKTDATPSKRVKAADALGTMDGQQNPEIGPALMEVLQRDTSSSVRREAAQALGRLRPATAEAAQALDQAAHGDASAFVRLQARTSRIGYPVPTAAPPPAPAKAGPPMPTTLPPPRPTTPAAPTATRPLPMPAPEGPTVFSPPADARPLPPSATFLPTPEPAPPQGAPKEKAEEPSGPILIGPKR